MRFLTLESSMLRFDKLGLTLSSHVLCEELWVAILYGILDVFRATFVLACEQVKSFHSLAQLAVILTHLPLSTTDLDGLVSSTEVVIYLVLIVAIDRRVLRIGEQQ